LVILTMTRVYHSSRVRLPGLRAGLVDLEYPQAASDLRPAQGESVRAGSENDVLADAVASLFHDQVLYSCLASKRGATLGRREHET
jgi:hypothetical protein